MIFISILFIVQCWTQASKPEPLKQNTQRENYNNINLFSTKNKHKLNIKQSKNYKDLINNFKVICLK